MKTPLKSVHWLLRYKRSIGAYKFCLLQYTKKICFIYSLFSILVQNFWPKCWYIFCAALKKDLSLRATKNLNIWFLYRRYSAVSVYLVNSSRKTQHACIFMNMIDCWRLASEQYPADYHSISSAFRSELLIDSATSHNTINYWQIASSDRCQFRDRTPPVAPPGRLEVTTEGPSEFGPGPEFRAKSAFSCC